jgi:hypothetical protein
LHSAKIFGGLSQVLDDVETYHPEEVKEALIAGLLSREGDVAVLFAAMLFYIFGKAKEPFDMNQRPFFFCALTPRTGMNEPLRSRNCAKN